MKKIILLAMILFLVTGCGKEKVTCTYENKELNYKNKRTLLITFEEEKVFNLKSTIEEEYTDEIDANNAYIAYQNKYNNYNENDVVSEYKKEDKKITAIYTISYRDIQNKKIEFEFDVNLSQDALLKNLKEQGYKCK
ncbi:MAG: membrane lipoprotein lipid attachment site-containing protein [Bacilli bacterium]|nr:membrane lipoprotein lipid attachment site-containing protein [Bacilli bacterium]